MTKEGKKAWTISAIIHVSAAVLLLVAGFISGCSDSRADEHVFEMIPSGDSMSDPGDESLGGGSPEDVVLPDIDVSAPEISPELPPRDEPPPTVISERPQVVDKPKDKPKEEPKKVSYDVNKYAKDQPNKKPTQNTGNKKPTGPNLNPGDYTIRPNSGKTSNTGGTSKSGGASDELSRYKASLRQIIESNWDQPSDLYADKLYTVVEFTVSKNGIISNVRIKKSSGNARFDATIRDAFARTKNVGPVPTGQSEDFSISFEMK